MYIINKLCQTKSLRFELRNTDPDVSGSKRAEIALPNEEQLEEHWYSFSTFLPNGGDEDYALDPNSSESIAQWHNIPDDGEPGTIPPLALITQNGHYYVNTTYNANAVSYPAEVLANLSSIDIGSYLGDKGSWVDWVFHVKWGWLVSQNPILKVYKNGVKVLDRTGYPNMTNDQLGVYFKIGIYKWDWAENSNSILTKRVIYHDAVSIK